MSRNAIVRALAASPLLRFALGGALLFAVDAWRTREANTLSLSPAFTASLREGLRRERGRDPTADELAAREREFLRDEALYRHALALGLQQGDEIVRRRLIQKATYLIEAACDPPTPGDDALRAWLAAHPDPAAVARITVEHRFFSRAPDADAGAGEPFLRGARFDDVTPAELDGVFGEGFAARVRALPPDAWGGPLRSAHGWHSVRWRESPAAQGDTLRTGRARAERGWREEACARHVDDTVSALVRGYRVERR